MVVLKLILWFLLVLLSLPVNCGVTVADTILLLPVLSWTSSTVVPIALITRLTQSIHLCFVIFLLILPGGTISSVCHLTLAWSHLFTCPNHLSLAFMHLSVLFPTSSLSLMLPFLKCSCSVWLATRSYLSLLTSYLYFVSSVQACKATTKNTTEENLRLESLLAGVTTLSQDTNPIPRVVVTLCRLDAPLDTVPHPIRSGVLQARRCFLHRLKPQWYVVFMTFSLPNLLFTIDPCFILSVCGKSFIKARHPT